MSIPKIDLSGKLAGKANLDLGDTPEDYGGGEHLAGTKFIAHGEDALSGGMNRPLYALGKNTDWLYGILRRHVCSMTMLTYDDGEKSYPTPADAGTFYMDVVGGETVMVLGLEAAPLLLHATAAGWAISLRSTNTADPQAVDSDDAPVYPEAIWKADSTAFVYGTKETVLSDVATAVAAHHGATTIRATLGADADRLYPGFHFEITSGGNPNAGEYVIDAIEDSDGDDVIIHLRSMWPVGANPPDPVLLDTDNLAEVAFTVKTAGNTSWLSPQPTCVQFNAEPDDTKFPTPWVLYVPTAVPADEFPGQNPYNGTHPFSPDIVNDMSFGLDDVYRERGGDGQVKAGPEAGRHADLDAGALVLRRAAGAASGDPLGSLLRLASGAASGEAETSRGLLWVGREEAAQRSGLIEAEVGIGGCTLSDPEPVGLDVLAAADNDLKVDLETDLRTRWVGLPFTVVLYDDTASKTDLDNYYVYYGMPTAAVGDMATLELFDGPQLSGDEPDLGALMDTPTDWKAYIGLPVFQTFGENRAADPLNADYYSPTAVVGEAQSAAAGADNLGPILRVAGRGYRRIIQDWWSADDPTNVAVVPSRKVYINRDGLLYAQALQVVGDVTSANLKHPSTYSEWAAIPLRDVAAAVGDTGAGGDWGTYDDTWTYSAPTFAAAEYLNAAPDLSGGCASSIILLPLQLRPDDDDYRTVTGIRLRWAVDGLPPGADNLRLDAGVMLTDHEAEADPGALALQAAGYVQIATAGAVSGDYEESTSPCVADKLMLTEFSCAGAWSADSPPLGLFLRASAEADLGINLRIYGASLCVTVNAAQPVAGVWG